MSVIAKAARDVRELSLEIGKIPVDTRHMHLQLHLCSRLVQVADLLDGNVHFPEAEPEKPVHIAKAQARTNKRGSRKVEPGPVKDSKGNVIQVDFRGRRKQSV